MRARCRVWVIGLGLLGGAGCSVVETGVHVVTYKVNQHLQEHAERQRNRKWADEAWQAVCQDHPDLARSEDYAAGFKDGFAEYVWRGGDGEPPPLPPLHYRAIRYQTPAGYQAIESWFAGYRHGAEAAQLGGYRDLVTGPSSLRSVPPDAAAGVHPVPLVEARSAAEAVHSLPLVEAHSAAEGKVVAPSLPSRTAQPLTAQPLTVRPLTAQPLKAAVALPPPSPAAEPTIPVDQRTDLATRWDWLDPRHSRPDGRPAQPSPPATAPEQPIRLPATPPVRLLNTSASADEGTPRNADGK